MEAAPMTDLLTPVAFASRETRRRRLSLMADFLILAMPILIVLLLVLLYADPVLGSALSGPVGAGPVVAALVASPVTRWAIIITSVFFAAVHIPVLAVGAMASGLATLFLLALILGWLMQRTGRIAAPIAAHSLFNLVNLMIFWFG